MPVTTEQRADFLSLAREGFKAIKPATGIYLDGFTDPTCGCAWGAAMVAVGERLPCGDFSIVPERMKHLGYDYRLGVVYGFDALESPAFHINDTDADAVANRAAGHEDGLALRKEFPPCE